MLSQNCQDIPHLDCGQCEPVGRGAENAHRYTKMGYRSCRVLLINESGWSPWNAKSMILKFYKKEEIMKTLKQQFFYTWIMERTFL